MSVIEEVKALISRFGEYTGEERGSSSVTTLKLKRNNADMAKRLVTKPICVCEWMEAAVCINASRNAEH